MGRFINLTLITDNNFSMKSERGMVLVVAILSLLVLTVIGISAIGTTTFEANISGNERVGADAFYSSEAILQVALNQLPDMYAIPRTGASMQVGTDSIGWTGKPADKGTPRPLTSKGSFMKQGYDQSWSFRRVQMNTTGQSIGATREVEVQVAFGPFSTQYNY